MSLTEYLQTMRRRWRWVAASALIGVLVAGIGSLATPPSYRATSSLFFSLSFGSSANDLAAGVAFAQSQVDSYALLASSPSVLEPVIDSLGLDTTARALAQRVSTEVVPETVVVEVGVTDASPARAAQITDAVTAQLVTTVEALAPLNDAGQPTVEATVIAPAAAPNSPVTPRTMLNVAIGLLAGLIGGILLALVRDLTDTRVRTADDLARLTHVPLLASLDNPPDGGGHRDLVVARQPHSAQAEAFRSLRTAVQFTAGRGGGLTLLVTSARPGEGKSTVAANLALTLSEAGLRVALVDADLRRPSVADTFDLEGAAGLTSVLIGHADLDEVLQEWGPDGLRVLTTGPLPPNPSELLSSPAMSDLLSELAADRDVVVIDAAPLLPVTDSAVLARMTSATLLVGDARRIRRPVLGQALTLLERAEARVAGVVLTHRRQRTGDAYGYAQDEPVTRQQVRKALVVKPVAGTPAVPRRPTTPAPR